MFFTFISPGFVLTFTWVVCVALYFVGSAIGYDHTYFRFMADQLGLEEAETPWAFTWIVIAYTIFMIGVAWGNAVSRRHEKRSFPIDQEKLLRLFPFIVAGTGLIAFLWIGVAIIQFGGIARIIEVASNENTEARNAIISASFPGGRLISSGFVFVTVLSATIIASNIFKTYSYGRKIIIYLSLTSALCYLAIAPILISGRINFFVACIGAYISASITRGRPIGVVVSAGALAFLIFTWTAKQYLVMGHTSEESVFSQAWQSILFYIYNDMYNALMTVEYSGDYHTYGWYSLRFVFFLTFTDKIFSRAISDSFYQINQWMGGGEIPLLSAPYIDFGFFGAIIIIFIGLLTQIMYKISLKNVYFSSIYGLMFSGLLLSTHSTYITSQEVAYNIIVLYILYSYTSASELK